MRGADRGQKAGLIWLAEHRVGLFRVSVVTISCCLIEFPDIGRFGVPHLRHTFFRFGGNLVRPRAFACSVGLRKLAGTNLGCQKVGVGHGPDEPEFVRRLVGVRPLWFREIRLSKPNWNLSRRPAVQTDRSSARRDHVARCLSSHLSIIECTHRADGDTRAPRTLDHARMPVAHVIRFKSQRASCQILSDDAHAKAKGALSKYRMAAPRRSTQRLASRAHASVPMTCGGYETAIGLGIEVWHAASRSRCERRCTDRDCTLHKASSALAMDPEC
jgi:hypothetical protein